MEENQIINHIGEIKIIDQNGKTKYFATSGGFVDIKPEGVQLLLETFAICVIVNHKIILSKPSSYSDIHFYS